MKVLIIAAGSHGDVLPLIALGKEFKQRGDDVVVFTGSAFKYLADEAGLSFEAFGSVEGYKSVLQDESFNDPDKWQKLAGQVLGRFTSAAFYRLAARVVPGDTIVIATVFAFAARSLAETYRIPFALVHLSPFWLRSNHRVPRVTDRAPWQSAPRVVKKFMWWLADTLFIDPELGVPLNQHRAIIGLPPVRRVLHTLNKADAVVGMFPRWFSEVQPDWPSKLHLTGFPMYDHGQSQSLSPEVEKFLAMGEPPVLFTAGTATAASSDFFAVSAEACIKAGKRGILLTQHPEEVPENLPEGIVRFSYVPFEALLPRVAAFVHHGGIGTMSQALRAGVPQLIRPMAFDQYDNVDLAVKHGFALELSIKNYIVDNVVDAIDRLTTDQTIRDKCLKVKAHMQANGVAQTCDYITDTLSPILHISLPDEGEILGGSSFGIV